MLKRQLFSSDIIGKKIVYLNHYSYFKLRNMNFKSDNIEFRFDGIFFAKQMSLLKCEKYNRHSFDFTSDAESFISKAKRILVIGGTQGDVDIFIKKIRSIFNTEYIIGIDGFKEVDYYISLDFSNFELIIIGMGTPKQELLLDKLQIKNSVIVTCGGFISQTASSSFSDGRFYPAYLNKFNLRWFFRLVTTSYVWKRLIFIYPLSAFLLIIDFLFYNVHEIQSD